MSKQETKPIIKPVTLISLENVIPNPNLEQKRLHLLNDQQLEQLDSAEAKLERGRRLFNGQNVQMDKAAANNLIYEAALLGHPAALAYCFEEGVRVKKDVARGVELYIQSAERGHPTGQTHFSREFSVFADFQR
jgi:TPR repeat protein